MLERSDRDELIYNIAETSLFDDDDPTDDVVRDWARSVIRLAQDIEDAPEGDDE